MNILVTGASGLLGINFCKWLKNNTKDRVIGIDDLSGSYSEPECDQFYKLNILEFEKVEDIFKENRIDIIYHFAAYATEGLSPFIRKYNYNNNLIATTNLVNMAIKYNTLRFVFTSSMAVYGKGNGELPFTEETPRDPIDPYGIAKYACEMDIISANLQHNLEYCIIRPHNVYGAGQNIWDMYRNVIGIWMYQVLNGEKITIYGDGEQKRAFSYIFDILKPLYLAGVSEQAKNEIINLGGTVEYSINETARIFNEILSEKVEIEYLEKRHEVKNAWTSHEKSVKLLGYSSSVSLKEGIKEMWEWAKKQPKRTRKKWEHYELDKGIYSYWK